MEVNKNPVDRIQSLIKYLPPGDIKFGEKFLKERNFESLKEIVDSALKIHSKRVKEGRSSDVSNIRGLLELKSSVDRYCSYCEVLEEGLYNNEELE